MLFQCPSHVSTCGRAPVKRRARRLSLTHPSRPPRPSSGPGGGVAPQHLGGVFHSPRERHFHATKKRRSCCDTRDMTSQSACHICLPESITAECEGKPLVSSVPHSLPIGRGRPVSRYCTKEIPTPSSRCDPPCFAVLRYVSGRHTNDTAHDSGNSHGVLWLPVLLVCCDGSVAWGIAAPCRRRRRHSGIREILESHMRRAAK